MSSSSQSWGGPSRPDPRHLSRSANVEDRHGVAQMPGNRSAPAEMHEQRPEPNLGPNLGASAASGSGSSSAPTPELAKSRSPPPGIPGKSSSGSMHTSLYGMGASTAGLPGSSMATHNASLPASHYMRENWNPVSREEVERNRGRDRYEALEAVAHIFPSGRIPRQTGLNYYISGPWGRQ